MQPLFHNLMLITDMDGTLLNSQSQVSKENHIALKYFVSQGGTFTLATGRSEQSVAPYLQSLPVNAPIIVYNGAIIYDFRMQKYLSENGLPEISRETVNDVLQRFPKLGVQIYQRGRTYFLRHNELSLAEQSKLGTSQEIVACTSIPFPWIKILLIGTPENLVEVETYLQAKPQPFRTVYSDIHYLELLPKGVSKGQALHHLLQNFVDPSLKTIAMGDNLNDLELIVAANWGIAVANAHPELKKHAKWACGHHDAHAVAQVIDWLKNRMTRRNESEFVLGGGIT